MAEKIPSLAELQNNLQFITPELDATKAKAAADLRARLPDSVDVETEDSDADIDRETCYMLGAQLAAGGVKLPTCTAGRFALLELCENPVVTEASSPTLHDVMAALYILECGPVAADPVFRAVRQSKAVEEAAGLAKGDPAMFAEYLRYKAAAARGWQEFDAAAATFGDGLGKIDYPTVMAAIRESLKDQLAPFRMLPPGKSNVKKNTGATVNGSRRSSPWPVRLWAGVMKTCSGKSR